MIVTEVTVFWYCPNCGQIWGVPQGRTIGPRLTRHDALTYLRAESACLVEQANALREELARLQSSTISNETCRQYCHKLRAYRGLLANHALALKWMMHPPHVVNTFSPPSVSALSAA